MAQSEELLSRIKNYEKKEEAKEKNLKALKDRVDKVEERLEVADLKVKINE
jgi:phage shock protein A